MTPAEKEAFAVLSQFSEFWSAHKIEPSFDPCSIHGCVRQRKTRGLCNAHYERLRKHGDPSMGTRPIGDLVRWLQNAWSTETDDCQIWPFPNDGNGYASFALNGTYYRVHRFACEMVNGPQPSPKHDASHECGASLCVNKKHIVWKLHVENIADKERHGTKLIGESHPQAKLTALQVAEIRSLRGCVKQRDLARDYGVSFSTITAIMGGRIWKDVAL